MANLRLYSNALIFVLFAGAAFAQEPSRPQTHESKKTGGPTSLQASPPDVNVTGSVGTAQAQP